MENNQVKTKGTFAYECNRSICHNYPAIYYNHSTRMYYCVQCAMMINIVNRNDAMQLFGHDLCTLGEPVEEKENTK